jgi:hypothetical protein
VKEKQEKEKEKGKENEKNRSNYRMHFLDYQAGFCVINSFLLNV